MCDVYRVAAAESELDARVRRESGLCFVSPPCREAVDINVLLEPDLESMLAEQLGAEIPEAPRCWYETSQGGIRRMFGPESSLLVIALPTVAVVLLLRAAQLGR